MFFVDKGTVLYAQYWFFFHTLLVIWLTKLTYLGYFLKVCFNKNPKRASPIYKKAECRLYSCEKNIIFSIFYKTDESVVKQTPNYVCDFVNSHFKFRHINEVII